MIIFSTSCRCLMEVKFFSISIILILIVIKMMLLKMGVPDWITEEDDVFFIGLFSIKVN